MTAPIVHPVALPTDYPDGPLADEIEAQVQRSLAPIHGMHPEMTEAERLQVYEQTISQQRDEFIELYGDPFGWEKRRVPREASTLQNEFYADHAVGAG